MHISCANMHSMNWDDLRILECCVRTGSFAKASIELGMSHSSISRRMTGLEQKLNIILLHRGAKGIRPTDTGLSIIAHAAEMASAALAVQNTTEQTEKLSGKIVFETIDATAFSVMPYLHEFSDLHPDIEISLRLQQSMANLSIGQADVVLRATNEPTENYVGYHVATHAFGIFGAADLVNRYPASTPLNDLPWVLWGNGWTDAWMEDMGLNPRVAMRVDTAYGMVQAMRDGIGIGHMACNAVAHDDQFLCLRAPEVKRDLQLWLLAHETVRRNQRVMTFMKFMRRRIAEQRPRIEGKKGSPTRPLNTPLL